MRRLALTLLAAAAAAAACAREDARPEVIEAYGASVQRDSLARELRLFIWPDYMDPELLSEFRRVYGVRVVTDYYDNNEALIAKLQAGGLGQYDVVVASDYAVEVLRQQEFLVPLDHALLPNLGNLDDRFRDLPFDPGNRYTATYQWGTSGLGIRADRLRGAGGNGSDGDAGASTAGDAQLAALATWRTVFEPEAEAGPFVMLADPRETIGAALIYLGHSANSTDPAELERAEALLLRQRPRLLTYAPFATGRDLLASGDVVVAHNYSGDVLMAQEEVPGIRYVIPREGAILWTDNLAIPARTPSAYTAHVFINFVLDAETGGRLSNFTRYASPNRAAWPFIDDALRADPSVYPPEEVMQRLEVLRDVGEARAAYDRIWTRLRAGR